MFQAFCAKGQSLSVHPVKPELRHEPHIPPHRQHHGDGDERAAERAAVRRHGGEHRSEPEGEDGRERDEPALAEGAGERPGVHRAGDVDLRGDHQQRQRANPPRLPRLRPLHDFTRRGLRRGWRRACASTGREQDEPNERDERERCPREQPMLRREQHAPGMWRRPDHLPADELSRAEVAVQRLVGEELRCIREEKDDGGDGNGRHWAPSPERRAPAAERRVSSA